MTKRLLAALIGVGVGLGMTPAVAQAPAPQLPAPYAFHRIPAPAEPGAIPLYAGAVQPAGASKSTEIWDTMGGKRVVRNVTLPTLTPVLPDPARATGAAVVVAPGGGYTALAMDGEGWPVARWLADHGVAAFVLKYRLNASPEDEQALMRKIAAGLSAPKDGKVSLVLNDPAASEDALAAIRMVREGAAKWKIDPARVGLIGFSAGANTVLDVALNAKAADMPNFAGSIYGPMVAVTVPAHAPPLFTALALDDPLFGGQGFGVVDSWRKAGRAVEVHGYERGGHGFGVGKPGTSTTMLLPEFLAWMQSRGLLAKEK